MNDTLRMSFLKGLAFDNAIDFFRHKLNMPSEHWDDLWKEQHAKGFMVAGAMKAELLTDLRAAVDKAIADGATIDDFRKDFDKLVSDHGWQYKGARNWRSNIIYDTNIRCAYQAGRYRQMTDPDVTAERPYLEYRHSDSSVNPRPQHVAWDGLILPHDDPWWDTHYPPNGYGCKCKVVTMSRRDLERMGKDGPDQAPEIEYRDWTDRDGKSHQVPMGIDPGWDYNVGQASQHSFKVLADKFETLPNTIARKWMGEYLHGPVFRHFFETAAVDVFPVAVLKDSDMAALGTKVQTVWLSKETLEIHKKKHPEVAIDDYRLIPEILDQGEVYRQKEAHLIYLKIGGRFYRAALKRTKDGRENYFLTLFTTSEAFADWQVREKFERIR